MDLSKYAVTTPFGWVEGYPLNRTDPVNHPNQGFHNGIDYGVPMNTPVIVNGVEIAKSNNTGATTGPHLHVGKYAGGAAVNPGVNNGTNFNSAVVFDVGKDAVNGNFVRITADGALWNYLHLADGSIKVKAGQVLNGGGGQQGDNDIMTSDQVTLLMQTFNMQQPGDDEIKFFTGKPLDDLLAPLNAGDLHAKVLATYHAGLNDSVNEGDRQNLNGALYGEDRGFFQDELGKHWKDAMYHIFETAPFQVDQLVNNGDVPAINSALSRTDGNVNVGKSWKDFFYGYLVKTPPPTSGDYTAADRAQATETNSIVKSIQNGISKLTSLWKV